MSVVVGVVKVSKEGETGTMPRHFTSSWASSFSWMTWKEVSITIIPERAVVLMWLLVEMGTGGNGDDCLTRPVEGEGGEEGWWESLERRRTKFAPCNSMTRLLCCCCAVSLSHQ